MITDTHNLYGPDGPEIEPALLLRYLVKRYDELLESDNPRINLTLGGLSLTGVARDEEAEKELRRILYPATYPDQALLNRCKEVFLRTLARTKEGQTPRRSGDDGRLPSLDERTCRQILLTALRESRRMIADDNYEYAKIIESTGWIALQCYPRRLKEFEDVWLEENPRDAIRRAVEVLRSAFSRRNRE